MKNYRILINNLLSGSFALILLFVSIGVRAQTIKADSVKFPIGSQIKITLEVPYTVNEKITWPTIGDTITKSIEVLSKSSIDTVKEEKSANGKLRQTIQITSFDTGFIVVPPISFIVEDNSQKTTVKTEPLLLEVFKIKIDPKADIKDIKPIIKAPITFRELLPWLAGLMIIGSLIYGLIYYLKKRKQAPIEKPQPKIRIPSWEIALEKLHNLKNEQLWQKGDIKEYYTKLTDILREYFELRYNVNAAEMTSSEIIHAMTPHIIDEKPLSSLRNVLFLSDMAKFAKAQPGAYENEQSILYSIELIQNTIPQQKVSNLISEKQTEVNNGRATE
ncbi:MAG TPA: hypothetical protein VK212_04780 [Lentimicrobium sp.]|nr:hypothetical protein [Lentimicrobium sp.]